MLKRKPLFPGLGTSHNEAAPELSNPFMSRRQQQQQREQDQGQQQDQQQLELDREQNVAESRHQNEKPKGRFGLMRSATVAGTKALRRPFTSSGPTDADSSGQRARLLRSPDLLRLAEGTNEGRATTSNGVPSASGVAHPVSLGFHGPIRSGTMPPTLLDRRHISDGTHQKLPSPLPRLEITPERDTDFLSVPSEDIGSQPPISPCLSVIEADGVPIHSLADGNGSQLKRSISKWNPFGRSRSRRVRPVDISGPLEQTGPPDTGREAILGLRSPPPSRARLDPDQRAFTTTPLRRLPPPDHGLLTPNSVLSSPSSEDLTVTATFVLRSPSPDCKASTLDPEPRSPFLARLSANTEADHSALTKVSSITPTIPPSPTWSIAPTMGEAKEVTDLQLITSPIAATPPTLAIDIPDGELERYSVMFGKSLDPKQSPKSQDGPKDVVEEQSEVDNGGPSSQRTLPQPLLRRATEPLKETSPRRASLLVPSIPKQTERKIAPSKPALSRSNTTPAKNRGGSPKALDAKPALSNHVASQRGHAKPAVGLSPGIGQRLVSKFNRSEHAPGSSTGKSMPSRSMSLHHNNKYNPSRRFALPPVPRIVNLPSNAIPEDSMAKESPEPESARRERANTESSRTEKPKDENSEMEIPILSLESRQMETPQTETPRAETPSDLNGNSDSASVDDDEVRYSHEKVEIFVARSVSVSRRPRKMLVPRKEAPPLPSPLPAETEGIIRVYQDTSVPRPKAAPPSITAPSRAAAHPGPLTSHKVFDHPGPLTSNRVYFHPAPGALHASPQTPTTPTRANTQPILLTPNKVEKSASGHLAPLTPNSLKAWYRRSARLGLDDIRH